MQTSKLVHVCVKMPMCNCRIGKRLKSVKVPLMFYPWKGLRNCTHGCVIKQWTKSEYAIEKTQRCSSCTVWFLTKIYTQRCRISGNCVNRVLWPPKKPKTNHILIKGSLTQSGYQSLMIFRKYFYNLIDCNHCFDFSFNATSNRDWIDRHLA